MKLYVDDIRNAPDESWTLARTINAAINALSRWDFEEISLDHDISHQIVMGEMSRPFRCDECFCAVARYIAAIEGTRASPPPKLTLHTSNPVGAEDMRDILKAAGVPSVIKLTGAANRLEMETTHP